ncbi:MAG TPA: carboxypeptidase-like regulatory domain-containing protein, partial [Terriglobia bacterium]|nr:carboxypeptidase-like regulatory domain-containing protein [Terriglobia bacterium]
MRIHTALKSVVLGVAVGLFAVGQLKADDIYGRIRGTVTDPSGAVIPGVAVIATNIATGVARSAKAG